MSRIIKFRAWDNVAEKMYGVGEESDVHFYFDSEGIKAERFFDTIHYTPEGGSDVCGDSETLEHLIYLQYTGLKDKNDVEIYEGDVVKHEDFSIGCAVDLFVTGEVKMLEGAWTVDDGSKSEWLWSETAENEIIGNIYENPEMLEIIE